MTKSMNRKPNIYSPQTSKFEGYTGFPRPVSRPYYNRNKFDNHNVVGIPKHIYRGLVAAENMSDTEIKKNKTQFVTGNVGVSHLTANLVMMKKIRPDVNTVFKNYESKLDLLKSFKF